MFPKLTSLLSNHVAPGGSHVSVSPFAFLIGARIEVKATAGDEAKRIEAIRQRLTEVRELLDADHLIRGRDALRAVIQDIDK
jgi:hypothetical protein